MTAQDDQRALTTWVLGAAGLAAESPLPDLDRERFAAAGLATGLTAAVASLLGDASPTPWRALLDEQRTQVEQRSRRFQVLLPQVLQTLRAADVAASPVKGAVLTASGGVWPWSCARPMSDIDLLVAPADRVVARDALLAAGLTLERSTPWEDSFLAWGDGGVGRTDGESADHNGKVEVHPGWVESIGPILLDGTDALFARRSPGVLADAPAHLLDPVATTAHVLGHLSSTVLRREVRALNVVDLSLCLRSLDDDARADLDALCSRLDPRFVLPGLWLLDAFGADAGRPWRSPHASRFERRLAAMLASCAPSDVLRVWGASTSFRWRWDSATGVRERCVVTATAVRGRWARRGDRAREQH